MSKVKGISIKKPYTPLCLLNIQHEDLSTNFLLRKNAPWYTVLKRFDDSNLPPHHKYTNKKRNAPPKSSKPNKKKAPTTKPN